MDETNEHASPDDLDAYPVAFHDYTRDAEFIGVGGFGVVFRAVDVRQPHEPLAVKFLNSDLAKIPNVRRRFIEEGRTLERLDHENCVRVRRADEQFGVPYIVMEFVGGKNVREMTPSGGLDPRTAAAIVAQAARGLHHAHTLADPIVHRDVKPSNILYDVGSGRAVVTDFGLAKRIAGTLDRDRVARTPLTPFGESTLGTVFYTPPEYIDPPDGECVIAPSADIYSLGATFYELLSGRPPYPVDGLLNGSAKFRAIAEIRHKMEPQPLPDLVPDSIRRICERAMNRSRAARFPSAAEMAFALETALHQLARQPERLILWRGSQARRRARRRSMAIVATGILGGAAALATWLGRTPLDHLGVQSHRPSTAAALAGTSSTPQPSRNEDQPPSALALETRALESYDETNHANERQSVRFDNAQRLFDQMRAEWPRYVRGRIIYLNCLMDFTRTASQADAERAARVAEMVLGELDRIGLGDEERTQVSIYRSYFSVFQTGRP